MPIIRSRPQRSWLKAWSLVIMILIALSTIWVSFNFDFFRAPSNLYTRYLRFKAEHEDIVRYEALEKFGSGIQLSICEEKANDALLSLKWAEQMRWLSNSTLHELHDRRASFQLIRKEIENSVMYRTLQEMPKAAVLQVHDIGMTKVEDIISLTYEDNLWVCVDNVSATAYKMNYNIQNNMKNYKINRRMKKDIGEFNKYLEIIVNQALTRFDDLKKSSNFDETKLKSERKVILQQLLDKVEQLKLSRLSNEVSDDIDENDTATENDGDDIAYVRDYKLFRFSLEEPTDVNESVTQAGYQNYYSNTNNSEMKNILSNALFSFNLTEDFIDNKDVYTCKWELLNGLRNKYGDELIDDELRNALIVDTDDHYIQWTEKIDRIRKLLNGLIYYAPVFPKYMQYAFENFHDDGVSYIEMRSELLSLYDLNDYTYNVEDTIDIIKDINEEAILRYDNFYGIKIIYCPPQNINVIEFQEILHKALELRDEHRDIFVGIDLRPKSPLIVSVDDEKHSLVDFLYPMWLMQSELEYYFSDNEDASESAFEKDDSINAFLLGSKRITFTSKLLRHPYLLRKVYQENLPIILTPVSNPLLQNADIMYHSHPATILFDFNMALVVSSEYPALFGTDPMTMDFYLLFMRLGDTFADIRTLKQLLYNSFIHSANTQTMKLKAITQWNILWSQWICKMQNVHF